MKIKKIIRTRFNVADFGRKYQNIFFFALDYFGRLCQNDYMLNLSKPTKKAFREYLNKIAENEPRHRNYRYQQRTRPYGDYLYAQDREKFNADYQDWLKEQGQR